MPVDALTEPLLDAGSIPAASSYFVFFYPQLKIKI